MIILAVEKQVGTGPKWHIAYKFVSLPNENMYLIFKKF